ncbi:hypothetical protein C1X35_23845 [Pseudomonas sp. FW306-1C-G01A]|nr:hypothetical protein C1X56_25720 [Pseudomonas sp. GW101-1A09]PMV92036.1 hypothetical protein C1X51_19435 [Pseudomonas sp. FW306-2-2C-B10A]PMV92497.1 hypothetical protein C1X55_28890 [Pseudomonas sp. GW460-C8]PMW01751.1 hypothetical protein C1X50_26335 [Pseudomonas sp. MPR-TSA4]PMW13316.1 hypothetical protein C1X40_24620 [Pseudomonas sp. GW456-11-11-14-TSB2]PMW13599.1 hypothetical protein C1X52_17140 [Pseudomonas sp. FW306-2-1A-C05A]PMW15162.1 hypothetical protein C1X53_27010 [Pseudomonas s
MSVKMLLWRGSLLPLGGEAAPNPPTRFSAQGVHLPDCDCFAAEREQAPSPQMYVRRRIPP